MKSLFNIDSPIMQKMSLLGSLMITGFFWLICCLPVVTIGASTTAMYRVIFDLQTDRNGKTLDFFRYFIKEFKKATILWGILLLAAALLYAQSLILTMPSISGVVYVVLQISFYLALIIWLFTFQYSFALTAFFENTIINTLKNALLMSIAHPLRSVSCILLTIFPVVLFFSSVSLFFKLTIVFIMLYPGITFYWKGKQLTFVFKKYIPKETEQNI